jgi:2-dehydropantoate 2-reductase
MRFAIYGSGAVGCYFGAKLQKAGHEAIFIARGGTLQAIRQSGVRIEGIDEGFHLRSVQITDKLSDIDPVDCVIIGVKTWQVEGIIDQLPALLHEDSRALTTQNGVEAPTIIAQRIGEGRVLGGVVKGFFFVESPGVIRHVGVRPSITFGSIAERNGQLEKTLLETLLQADIHAEIPQNTATALWEKFLLVCSLSGVGAITRSPIGAIRAYPSTRNLLIDVMHEIHLVAQAHEIALHENIIDQTMAFVDTFPYEATASMQRDIMDGLPSELEAQTGAVVRLGKLTETPTPLNQFIYDSLILQELTARKGPPSKA